MLNDMQMELLNTHDAYKNYRVYAREYYMPRHSYFIVTGGHKFPDNTFVPLKADLLRYKSLRSDGGLPYFEEAFFSPYHTSKVKCFASESARRMVEMQNCINLKPVTGLRQIEYNGITFGMVGLFDGLEESKPDRWVWSYVPYTRESYARIANLSHSSVLTDEERLMIEHQMLVSNSRLALITCSDGTQQNTVTGRYISSPLLREHLLKCYAAFEYQVQEAHNGKKTGSQ